MHEGEWVPVSCETSNSFNETIDMMGTTTRDNGGWKSSRPTEQSYTLDLSGQVLVESETNALTYYVLKEKKRNKELIQWKREVENVYTDKGEAYITEISDESAAEGLMTFSMSLEGYLDPDLIKNLAGALADENNSLLVNDEDQGLQTN